MQQFHKIPKDRIGAMIGPDGQTKREIMKRTGIRVDVDSENGEVTIDYENARDPSMVLKIADIVKAIGRGFSPERAFALLKDDCYFALFDIQDYVGKRPDNIHRMKARVIGTGGKTRRIIEELAEVELCVYGDTIGVIGDIIALETAKVALDMILNGAEHSSVYTFLEHKRRDRHLEEMHRPEPREDIDRPEPREYIDKPAAKPAKKEGSGEEE
jgi:ribosomal RNA assembly protein